MVQAIENPVLLLVYKMKTIAGDQHVHKCAEEEVSATAAEGEEVTQLTWRFKTKPTTG